MSYRGQILVSEGSFLRTLPTITNNEQMMLIEALVSSCDMLTVAYQNIVSFAAFVQVEVEKIDWFMRGRLFMDVWTIVNQLHAVRKILESVFRDNQTEQCKSFLKTSAPVREIRNGINHIPEKIKNQAKKKKRSPLLGSLSYYYAGATPDSGGYIITIMSGTFIGGESMPIVNPAGREFNPPASLFEITSFGQTFEFAPSLSELKGLISWLEQEIEESIKAQVEVHVKENDVTVEKLMAHRGSGFSFAFKIQMDSKPRST